MSEYRVVSYPLHLGGGLKMGPGVVLGSGLDWHGAEHTLDRARLTRRAAGRPYVLSIERKHPDGRFRSSHSVSWSGPLFINGARWC